MTLRADIRDAIDGVAPPAPDLERLAVAAVFPARGTRLRSARARGSSRRRLRGVVTVAAALVVISLMAGLVVGGRLWLTFAPPSPADGVPGLRDLESRPLTLPALAPGEPCPVGPMTQGMYGSTEVFTEQGDGPATAWGTFFNGDAVTDGHLRGPILVRARDLRTGESVVFVGIYAAGRSMGADDVDGKVFPLRAELVLDPAHPPMFDSQSHFYAPEQVYWGYMFGLPHGSSGCVGWQVDNAAFTETFVTVSGG